MVDSAARQRARDAAADQVAAHHEVICPKNSGFAPPPTPRRHGTYSSYTGGCRCEHCREAQRLYRAAYRAAKKAAD
jgi:hypothetical protein